MAAWASPHFWNPSSCPTPTVDKVRISIHLVVYNTDYHDKLIQFSITVMITCMKFLRLIQFITTKDTVYHDSYVSVYEFWKIRKVGTVSIHWVVHNIVYHEKLIQFSRTVMIMCMNFSSLGRWWESQIHWVVRNAVYHDKLIQFSITVMIMYMNFSRLIQFIMTVMPICKNFSWLGRRWQSQTQRVI